MVTVMVTVMVMVIAAICDRWRGAVRQIVAILQKLKDDGPPRIELSSENAVLHRKAAVFFLSPVHHMLLLLSYPFP